MSLSRFTGSPSRFECVVVVMRPSDTTSGDQLTLFLSLSADNGGDGSPREVLQPGKESGEV
eukprot:CAMPEP_0175872512 /NCGR_PEP_ID=MMETSP0107_2-20121207/37762_1 /TAXON_ID=195067 ORGANISM="Goniomonas pacifica, Strain CCMP1869" /NCGR_SAMPLE_ID=MMETSP0107_2 /ASSEMBLY_ACC=CAM_ASM_000203 /LENGTH=60 /DNA_ID=CAMNT_0017191071 /DNA_START=99 /DNA_END=281 /DNA_ORIENTATION=+